MSQFFISSDERMELAKIENTLSTSYALEGDNKL